MHTTHFDVNSYGDIASEIYDIDKPFGALPDTAFFIEALAEVRGPILEPACGSGRTLVPLLEAGHEMAGFDRSAQMLVRCTERCAAGGFTADLRLAAYEDFDFDRTFAALIVPVGSFSLIGDFETALAVLRRFRRHLDPGGLLFVDQPSLAGLFQYREDLRSWRAPSGDLLTVHGQRVAVNALHQRLDYQIRYERWREGRLIAAEFEPMTQRFWGRDEFALALGATGFGDVEIAGNYARTRAPREKDRTLTFIARAV